MRRGEGRLARIGGIRRELAPALNRNDAEAEPAKHGIRKKRSEYGPIELWGVLTGP